MTFEYLEFVNLRSDAVHGNARMGITITYLTYLMSLVLNFRAKKDSKYYRWYFCEKIVEKFVKCQHG